MRLQWLQMIRFEICLWDVLYFNLSDCFTLAVQCIHSFVDLNKSHIGGSILHVCAVCTHYFFGSFRLWVCRMQNNSAHIAKKLSLLYYNVACSFSSTVERVYSINSRTLPIGFVFVCNAHIAIQQIAADQRKNCCTIYMPRGELISNGLEAIFLSSVHRRRTASRSHVTVSYTYGRCAWTQAQIIAISECFLFLF